ncbi:aerolysin [Nematostella vectensis]|uniref:aerolysin n=1 Tax=Nematostella vectensis TaxID=45351 RepID=UPI0020777D15|nr:aerolysin [Nematostella vectensis]
MFFAGCPVLLALALLVSPLQGCSEANWQISFDKEGYSTCNSKNDYINGLYRNNNAGGNDGIHLIEKARCCPIPYPFWYQPTDCVIADWVHSLDNNYRWSTCPGGHFLQGLYRSGDKWLHNIEYGKCCKPANHPHWWGHCYNQDVGRSFDNVGTSKCNDGYFMTGVYRGSCNKLYCIESFKCCKMVNSPPALTSLSEVKTRVMDTAMNPLARLANYLGYGWCASCRAQWVGEDFRRNGDSWEADKKGPCNGYKGHHRLKMHFGNFKFGIKRIKYGNLVIQSMKPEVYYSGTVRNNDPTPLIHKVEREVRDVRTVTHTTTSSWKASHELGVEISYTPPGATGGFGGKVSYKFNYESSSTTTDTNTNTQWFIDKVMSEKTLAPYTAAEYRIMLTRTRITVPYTATIIAHFSAELDGFLRWGGGYNGDSTNYHYQHRGSKRRSTVKYRFGDASTPLYQDLKDKSSRNIRPWQWHDMTSRYQYAQSLINQLADERLYEFTLTGQFEDVVGQDASVLWKTVSLNGKRRVEEVFPTDNTEDPPRVFPKPPTVVLTPGKRPEIPEDVKGSKTA